MISLWNPLPSRGRVITRYCLPACGVLLVALSCARNPRPPKPSNAPRQGLWDAHAHLSWYGEGALDSMITYGVVGVRDVGGDALQLLQWRAEIQHGTRRGPMIFLAGPVIDGPKRNPQFRASARSVEEGRRIVDSLADLGVDFIKTHNGLAPEVYFAVVRQAHARNLKVASHLPRGVPAWMAVDSGVESIEHASESMLASPIYAGYATTVEEAKAWWRSAAGDTMLARLGRQHAVVDPTLVTYRAVAMSEPIGPSRDAWLDTFRFLKELTGRMQRAGITLLAGTDFVSPGGPVVPGRAVLEEIQLLEESGLSHREALAAASVNVVAWLQKRPP